MNIEKINYEYNKYISKCIIYTYNNKLLNNYCLNGVILSYLYYLIERYNNSEDGIQHGIDFINGPNFDKFFEMFEIESFITIGNASDEFKEFATENGFVIEYRESIGGYVRR